MNMRFGEKLRKYRKEKGLTQAQLAKAADISLKTVINYENGKTYPQNREIYARLAELLEIDADYLHNENDAFISAASEKYGHRGKRQAEDLVNEFTGLFAGGELTEQDKDAVMQALQRVYWDCKEVNAEKYAPKK